MSEKLNFEVGANGANVFLTVNGKGGLLHWREAKKLWKAIRLMAQRAESQDLVVVEKLIDDQAILHRHQLGGILGMTADPKIRAEAKKNSEWDTKYRRMGNTAMAQDRGVAYPPALWPEGGVDPTKPRTGNKPN